MPELRALRPEEIEALTRNGCTAPDWKTVTVRDGFDPRRVRNATFLGHVTVGRLAGSVAGNDDVRKPSGIFNAVIADSTIGNECRIANVGVHIAGYDIGDGACIEDIGTLAARPGAAFGNGVAVAVLNEGGGREVILFNELSAQFAYLMCVHRHRPRLIEQLTALAEERVERARSDRGMVGAGACVRSTTEIRDVAIGSGATVNGAASLKNGTILSTPNAASEVGVDVTADDFIIAEGAAVAGGVILSKTFVGQGCRLGKQFSAENSLFFANCEGYHGEACSVFAGPYTVTHHKSSLLIAGLFSFCNAGSGTNQSNHMYKLGPVHEGKLGRGTKTGSFSYMMWPCRTGPFSVVMGKNTGTFDTADYPFSHLEARPDGRTMMIPGFNVVTVGTVRDGAKWPARDRRTGPVKRDAISFPVFSPYVVGRMVRGRATLSRLQRETDRSVEEVLVGGALVRRPLLRTGQKFYRNAIQAYLYEKVFERSEGCLGGGLDSVRAAFASGPGAVHSENWVDISGLLMPQQRLRDLEDAIEAGVIKDCDAFFQAIDTIAAAYDRDEWVWVKNAFREETSIELDRVSREDLLAIADQYLAAQRKFFTLILADAAKEFDPVTRSGFGQDGREDDRNKDFEAVRGTYEQNSFVRDMEARRAALQQRVETFKTQVAGL